MEVIKKKGINEGLRGIKEIIKNQNLNQEQQEKLDDAIRSWGYDVYFEGYQQGKKQ